ncbi:EAL domain-containing protein [Pseudoduganella sp. FT25W]|uniref:EAL domain-containing protein n=1 Tax=Duganella alba TaxID=2666081 RepID=A0A6L5QAS2_9BURK|nr:EAL domain-containing protein [Duganella alba]MRX17978.1 EAL domain-containing protein [Duganella alba]
MLSFLAAFKRRSALLLTSQHTLIPGAFVLGLALLIYLWALHFTRIQNEKKLALEATTESSRNIATIVATNLEEVLGRSSLYARITSSNAPSPAAKSLHFNPQQVGDSAYLRAAVYDQDGKLVYSSAHQRTETELQPLLDQALRGGQPTDSSQVLIGHPPVDGNGAWRLPILVPLGDERRGYYGAILDLGYILSRYREVELGQGGSIELIHSDGLPLAVLREGALSFDTRLPGSHSTLPGDMDASTFSSGPTDLGYLSSVHSLAHYPIQVAVTQNSAVVLGRLAAQHQAYLVRTLIFSAVVILVILVVVFSLRHQHRLHQAVASSEQEKKKLIDLLEQEKTRALALASHDYLTGIPNRRQFQQLASSELKRARRSRNLYALLFFDLDRFKLVNDNLGHAVGDLLLKAVATRLQAAVRNYDLVARLGGDEFVVLLSEIPSEEFVSQLAANLVRELSQTYVNLDGHNVETSPSVGIALYPRDGQSVDDLLLHADHAMYSAKARGRGVFRFYDASLNASSARRSELASRFKSAMHDNEFCLHFQPKVALDDFAVVGLEALIRWDHPEHGLIFPGDFIPLAEEQNYIIPLGRWVIDAVCRQIAAWHADAVPLVPVAINVSAHQLRDNLLPEDVIASLVRHDVNPAWIEIEITESSLIEDTQLARRNLESLAAIGIKIALDDYGTGFSGLSMLKQLPINAVKVDRSFIRDIRNDTDDAVIVASTISLAHNLGLIVVAEGVESKDQLLHLKAAGCDQVQGFFLQRPVSAQDIAPLLRKRHYTFPSP